MKKHINIIALVVAAAGIGLSVYMWWFQVVGAEYIPCTVSGCASVLASEYGKMFGIPIAVYGFFYYVIIALLIFQKQYIKHILIDRLLYASIIWGFIYSCYLRYLEFAKIGEICAWCWLSVLFIVLLMGIYGKEFVGSLKKKQ